MKYAEIPLTQGLVAIVDESDFAFLSLFKWCAMRQMALVYAVTGTLGRNVSMHRLLMNEPRGLLVDHRDGNGLDNRRSNIRVCTKTQNQQNLSLSRRNTSGYKGVSWDSRRGKYSAALTANGEHIRLGRFDTKVSAAIAYNIAAASHHGPFARLNNVFSGEVK